MTVLFVLFMFGLFLGIDYVRSLKITLPTRGTTYTTPGYEFLGALAQDGGESVDKKKTESK